MRCCLQGAPCERQKPSVGREGHPLDGKVTRVIADLRTHRVRDRDVGKCIDCSGSNMGWTRILECRTCGVQTGIGSAGNSGRTNHRREELSLEGSVHSHRLAQNNRVPQAPEAGQVLSASELPFFPVRVFPHWSSRMEKCYFHLGRDHSGCPHRSPRIAA